MKTTLPIELIPNTIGILQRTAFDKQIKIAFDE